MALYSHMNNKLYLEQHSTRNQRPYLVLTCLTDISFENCMTPSGTYSDFASPGIVSEVQSDSLLLYELLL